MQYVPDIGLLLRMHQNESPENAESENDGPYSSITWRPYCRSKAKDTRILIC